MESKLTKVKKKLTDGIYTFNRTSMESKRAINRQALASALFLLIEPVWNRNRFWHVFINLGVNSLLIEPVWNRNILVINLSQFRNELLIEPVWNRNTEEFWKDWAKGKETFNRTSMESKLVVGLICFRFNPHF